MSDGTTLLFGLPGVRVERVERLADGTRVVQVATARRNGGGVPVVWGGVHLGEGPGDHRAARHPLRSGPNRGAVEQDPLALPGGLLRADLVHRGHRADPGAGAHHPRLRTQIGAAIGTRPARWPRSPPPTACRGRPRTAPFVAHAEAVLAEPQPTPVLGIDETRRGKPRWERCAATGRWVRVDPWDTGFVDLAGDQGLLGQREGRTGAAVIDWLSERTRSSARPSSTSRSTQPPSTPRRSAHPGCCRTRRSWSTTSTW